jgi:1,4-alpha-glucan branching enzyme
MDRWPAVHGDLGFDFLWALGDPFTWREGVDAGAVDPSRRATRLAELISGYGLSLEAALVRYPLGSHDNILEQHNGDTPAQRHFVEWAGGRLDWYAQAKARMGWSLATVLPGLPMMFMGAECHHAGYWAPAPDANPVWNDHRFDWGQVADETGRAMLAFVRGANKLRWAHPALRGPWTELLHVDPTNAVVAFQRTAEGEEPCVIVVNASDGEWRDTPYQVPVAGLDGAWRPVFDSHLDWPDAVAGHGAAPVVQGVLAVPVPRWSVVMLVREAAA